ncbi:MAG: hypothetical protein K0S74_227 [Chlamydiales bacterium]|jgi:tetratricopeptide (TPR) repeat protein|nr:hypothetical protein [Chlamydiales bacterium]
MVSPNVNVNSPASTPVNNYRTEPMNKLELQDFIVKFNHKDNLEEDLEILSRMVLEIRASYKDDIAVTPYYFKSPRKDAKGKLEPNKYTIVEARDKLKELYKCNNPEARELVLSAMMETLDKDFLIQKGIDEVADDVAELNNWFLNELNPKVSQNLGTSVKMVLVHAYSLLLVNHVNLYHEGKLGKITTDLKTKMQDISDEYATLSGVNKGENELWSAFAIEAIKRVKDNTNELAEVARRLSCIFTAIGHLYNKELGLAAQSLITACDGLEKKIKASWFDQIAIMNNLVIVVEAAGNDPAKRKVQEEAFNELSKMAKYVCSWQSAMMLGKVLSRLKHNPDLKHLHHADTIALTKLITKGYFEPEFIFGALKDIFSDPNSIAPQAKQKLEKYITPSRFSLKKITGVDPQIERAARSCLTSGTFNGMKDVQDNFDSPTRIKTMRRLRKSAQIWEPEKKMLQQQIAAQGKTDTSPQVTPNGSPNGSPPGSSKVSPNNSSSNIPNPSGLLPQDPTEERPDVFDVLSYTSDTLDALLEKEKQKGAVANHSLWTHILTACNNEKDFELALKYCIKIEKHYSDRLFIRDYREIANTLDQLSQFDQAIRKLERGLEFATAKSKTDPRYNKPIESINIDLGIIHQHRGKTTGSLSDLKTAIKYFDTVGDTDALLNRASAKLVIAEPNTKTTQAIKIKYLEEAKADLALWLDQTEDALDEVYLTNLSKLEKLQAN